MYECLYRSYIMVYNIVGSPCIEDQPQMIYKLSFAFKTRLVLEEVDLYPCPWAESVVDMLHGYLYPITVLEYIGIY
jgi:hypothetical protein